MKQNDSCSFTKPPWVFSRTYDYRKECSKTIITNTQWCADFVLDGKSSDIWNALPQSFNTDDLQNYLIKLDIDVNNSITKSTVLDFLSLLHRNGLLVSDMIENPPKPDISEEQEYYLQRDELPYVTAKFNKYLRGKNLLSSALVELTYSCNENCVHCFNPKNVYNPKDNISTSEVIQAIRELYDIGINNIFFSGGEATLRPDFFEILDETKRLNIPFSLYTNGQFDEKYAKKMASYFPKMVAVSIYSASPEIHDATTRKKGSFVQSIKTIQILSELGVFISIKCPIMAHTVYGYKKILDLAKSVKAVPMFDVQIRPTFNGDQITNTHQVRDKDVLTQLCLDPNLLIHVNEKQLKNGGYRRAVNDGYICASGRNILSISPNGDIYPCNCMPLKLGNIKTDSIKTIWETSEILHAWQSVTLNHFDECGMHEECSYCRICPAESVLETNRWFGKPRSFCEIARIRMETAKRLRNHDASLQLNDSFGNELSFIAPKESVRGTISKSFDSEAFLKEYNTIYAEGNKIRNKLIPEKGSLVDLNISKEDYELDDNFFDGGRR